MAVTRIVAVAAVLFTARPATAFGDPVTGDTPVRSETNGSTGAPLQIIAPTQASITLLADPRFEIREQATRALEKAGLAAIAPLREAAAGENLEVTSRAIRSLASILDTDDDATFDAAEGALEQLESSTNRSAARRAEMALGSQSLRRWKRAVVRLNRLGAGVEWRNRSELGLPEHNSESGGNLVPANVMLFEKWSGGSAGLINIKRLMLALNRLVESQKLPPMNLPLPVYVIDGADVSPEALDDLRRSLPGLEIQERGRAKLGVLCESGAGPCTILRVVPNQAAEKAGLQRNDIVVSYDGESVANFEQLTQITRRHKVADRVKIEVQRDGQIVELEAELMGWDDAGTKPKE